MKILMMTNTYLPHVGGVARSVWRYTKEFRDRGHKVVVVAPTYEGMPEEEKDVIRIPAIQNFNGSDFSVSLPIPGFLSARLEEMKPDIIHSHHPFLIGNTALRVASQYQIPLVFTHHTMYEQYTHYVPADSQRMKRFVIELATGYANLAEHVIAPSESIAKVLQDRGVETPIRSIPTGVYVEEYREGDGEGFRKRHNIPGDAFVVGHVGRLAPEKNLPFLGKAVSEFLKSESQGRFLVVGDGPSAKGIQETFVEAKQEHRLRLAGRLQGKELVDAYHAMDLFAFASLSETQGMVLAEAMASGVPVAAIDAPGAREVVHDRENGRLVMEENREEFARALSWLRDELEKNKEKFTRSALETADYFSMSRCTDRMMEVYQHTLREMPAHRPLEVNFLNSLLEQIKTEWELVANVADSVAAAIKDPKLKDASKDD